MYISVGYTNAYGLLFCCYRMRSITSPSHQLFNASMVLFALDLVLMTIIFMLPWDAAHGVSYSHFDNPTSTNVCLTVESTDAQDRLECGLKCNWLRNPHILVGFTYMSDGSCYCWPITTGQGDQVGFESQTYIMGTSEMIPGT